jgi:subtilisin-like proprotein convertase family protein/subtilisin family serine protease
MRKANAAGKGQAWKSGPFHCCSPDLLSSVLLRGNPWPPLRFFKTKGCLDPTLWTADIHFFLCALLAVCLNWSGTVFAQTALTEAVERYQFRMPRPMVFRMPPNSNVPLLSVSGPAWVRAWPESGPTNAVELGNRLVLQLEAAADLPGLIQASPLHVARTVTENVFVLEAPDARTAIVEAHRLGQLPRVRTCHPVMRRFLGKHGPYAAQPNDPYYTNQWPLENRAANGQSLGPDLNVRAAWPFTRGEGVIIGFGDDGVELTHPELSAAAAGAPHYNFFANNTNALPSGPNANHATAAAGLALARDNNWRGIAGVAPRARVASWVIFGAADSLASDEEMMDMFQFHADEVAVQNHSWGNAGVAQLGPTLLEQIGISNAVMHGRQGRGVIMVRSGGNGRTAGFNADDDGYISSPWSIAVGAINQGGRAATYSNPGACLLVAAPSGDPDAGYAGLFTTDRQGTAGYNQASGPSDLADYAYGATGFSGTSASAPLISGVVALMLSANPNLSYRDVQQILALSARHYDLANPDLLANGAGLRVSHDTGYGVPDAGVAVTLARRWNNRPDAVTRILSATNRLTIPLHGLQLVCDTEPFTNAPQSIPVWAGVVGLYPDRAMDAIPLVYVGLATNEITTNLAGKGAFIQRGTNFFIDKIKYAAMAGARFAVVFNNRDTDQLVFMTGTDYFPIPAVFIGQRDGEALRATLLSNLTVNAQIRVGGATYSFPVTETMICEHVGVRVTTDHPHRGELRVTLTSPQGTVSGLQTRNNDSNRGPVDWTYYSTHHFLESSAGIWTVTLSNEAGSNAGSVESVELRIHGVPVQDSDRDGLDDGWERAHFQTLAYGPQDDPDGDGYTNAREQAMGTDPTVNDASLQLDLSRWNVDWTRLSWPGLGNWTYEIWGSGSAVSPLKFITNVPGAFPQTEWFLPVTNQMQQFFQVRTRGLIIP